MSSHSRELFAGTPDEMTDAERELEARITAVSQRLWSTSSRSMRMAAFEELRLLHRQRSAHSVARMEKKQGVR